MLNIPISLAIQTLLFTIAIATALMHIIYRRVADDVSIAKQENKAIDAKLVKAKEEILNLIHEIESQQMAITNNFIEHFVKKEDCEKKHKVD